MASCRPKKKSRGNDSVSDNELPLDPRSAAQLAVPKSERYNPSFEEYYSEQLFGKGKPSEYGKFSEFLCALKVALGMTLRVQQTRSKAVRMRTGEQLVSLKLKQLDWVDKLVVPSDNEPSLVWECSDEEYHARPELEAFCRKAHRGGAVNFQESVSMLPALLLDIQHHHNVADVCAAPGSKTTLVLDLMHRSLSSCTPQGPFPSGMVIASEFDSKRAKLLLAGRVRHLTTPNCLIGIAPAQSLPEPLLGGMFDRVLADVPCSGDGTIRKDPRVWRSWSPKDGLELHGIQLKILRKALKLLKPGGVLAYSTCSFNPIENEAVVTAALVGGLMFPPSEVEQSIGGDEPEPEFELIDIHTMLQEKGVSSPSLQLAPGLTSWRVPLLDINEDHSQSRRWGPKVDPQWQEKYLRHQSQSSDSANSDRDSGGGEGGVEYDRSSWWADDLDTYLDRRYENKSANETAPTTHQSPPRNKHKKTPPKEGWLPAGVKRTMFPASQEFSSLNKQLTKCARVLPNKQNGGGFFVALIKRKEYKTTNMNPSESSSNNINMNPSESSSNNIPSSATEENIHDDDVDGTSNTNIELLTTQRALYESLREFYGLKVSSSHSGLDQHKASEDNVSTSDSSVLLVEGPRVVLTSTQLSNFITQTLPWSLQSNTTNYHQSEIEKTKNSNKTMSPIDFKVHTFGLRVFLKLQTNQIRASVLRWRPCQEGIGWLAKNSTKRKLLMDVDLLQIFLEKHIMSNDLAAQLSQDGLLKGYSDILYVNENQTHKDNDDAGRAGGDNVCRNTIVAGGLLVGLKKPRALNIVEVDVEVDASDCVWVACLATTKSIHVYADENSLFGMKELLLTMNSSPSTRKADIEALFIKHSQTVVTMNENLEE